MKNIILGIAVAVTTMAICNSNISTRSQNSIKNPQMEYPINIPSETTSTFVVTSNTVSIKEIVRAYLLMKNAFTEDNSSGAASAGKILEAVFKNLEVDAREHAEHIGASGGNIAHQREHFELLSKDIYDLVKAFGGGQVLYKDYDPMFNNGKGAFWLSETKEIKNPYMGKAMLTSGSVKEEIK
jgi:hypothetical protein